MSALAAVAAPDASSQPGLALEIFGDLSRVMSRYIVHAAADDHNAPLIRRGEVVVVDTGGASVTGGWLPTEGGLFLIEYCSPPYAGERYERRSRSIVQTFTDHEGRWHAGGLRRGSFGGKMVCSDGPYADELILADKLIGKVVGIYQPAGTLQ